MSRNILALHRLWSHPPFALLFSTTLGPHPHVPEAEKRSLKGVKPWRDAASLIIVAPNPEDKQKTDFLVIKRSKDSKFFPNTLCFPGGVICPEDSDEKWMDLYRSELAEVQFMADSASLPPIYRKRADTDFNNLEEVVRAYKEKRKVNPQVALRIAAVRETFEECGILICKRITREDGFYKVGRKAPLGCGYTAETFVLENPNEVEKWQQRVRRDPAEFYKMCLEFQIRPEINAIVEWSNWLTPNSFGLRRFDTIFYMVVVPHIIPYLGDEFEVATIRWTSPDKVLQGAKDGKATLISPQIYELTRLRNTSIDKLKQLMRMRLSMGIERWCPCYIQLKDGMISVNPGDDLYPPNYKIHDFEDIRVLEKTLEEARKSTKNHHRVEFKSLFDFQLVVNVSPRYGQVYLD